MTRKTKRMAEIAKKENTASQNTELEVIKKEQELTSNGVLLSGEKNIPKQEIRISRRTVWENLTIALSTYFSSVNMQYPCNSGDWAIREVTNINTPVGFMVIYDNIRCFTVESCGRTVYRIGNRIDCDMKDYRGIGKKVIEEMHKRNFTVENETMFM